VEKWNKKKKKERIEYARLEPRHSNNKMPSNLRHEHRPPTNEHLDTMAFICELDRIPWIYTGCPKTN